MIEGQQQVCTMTVMFPCDDDDQAVAYKKKFAETLASIPESRIDFRLTTTPKPRAERG